MSSTNVTLHPSTLGGIKRNARFLKKSEGLTHSRALEQAARNAGFQNYKHALNSLQPGDSIGSASAPLHQVFISVYWRDREKPAEIHGRETLTLQLSRPWKEIISPRELRACRGLSPFRADADDHLEARDDVVDQRSAREVACAAARSLRFMEATGLRPLTRQKKTAEEARSIPRHDHVSTWVHPESGRIVTLDEPYRANLLVDQDRQQWARTHGFRVEAPTWSGLYSPGHAHPYFISHNEHGVPLDELIERVEHLPEQRWSGQSAPFSPAFVSPARARLKTPKRNRPADPFHQMASHHNSVGYAMMGTLPRRRPDAKMSLSDHRAAAKILNRALQVTRDRTTVYRNLDSVRSDLDEWVQRELTRDEMSESSFHQLYYDEADREHGKKPSVNVARTVSESLDELIALLTKRYPNCAPLREVLRKVRRAQKSLQVWVPHQLAGEPTLRTG